jgi:hypothetical protein
MADFKSTATRQIGSTPVTIHSASADTVVVGVSASNIYGSELPINIMHKRSSINTYILRDFRVGPGETKELMQGNKIVLQSGDELLAQTSLADGFDTVVSVLEGV